MNAHDLFSGLIMSSQEKSEKVRLFVYEQADGTLKIYMKKFQNGDICGSGWISETDLKKLISQARFFSPLFGGLNDRLLLQLEADIFA